MKTEQSVKILSLMSKHFADIIEKVKSNKDFAKEISKIGKKDSDVKTLVRLFPQLVELCGDDIYSVVAIYSGVTAEEIKLQDFSETVKTLKDIINDRGLIDFFSLFFGNAEAGTGTAGY